MPAHHDAELAENSPEQLAKPTVLLISLDGFRHDFLKIYAPLNLTQFANEGTAAAGIIPVFPSLTFPNHYALITGLTAEHHGLIANHFYDPVRNREYSMRDTTATDDGTWYAGVPLWSAAVQQGMLAASYYWVSSSAEIGGSRPTYWMPYTDTTPHEQRIAKVMEWLKLPEKNRPHFVTLYFSSVDHVGHDSGPESSEERAAVLALDRDLGSLFEQLKLLPTPVDVIIVSDHGMQTVDRVKKGIPLDGLVDAHDFRIFESGGSQVMLYARSPEKVDSAYATLKKAQKHFHVYRKREIPEKFHYRNNPVIPDLLLVADLPYSLGFRANLERKPHGGMHGYDPANEKMWGIFYARGPHIQSGKKIPAFKNIHLYPFVISLLGLRIPQPVDGDEKILAPVLKP